MGSHSRWFEARAPQSRTSRWQFPLDCAFNMCIWRMVGTTYNSPDTDDLYVVPFLAGRPNLELLSRGNPEQRRRNTYFTLDR